MIVQELNEVHVDIQEAVYNSKKEYSSSPDDKKTFQEDRETKNNPNRWVMNPFLSRVAPEKII